MNGMNAKMSELLYPIVLTLSTGYKRSDNSMLREAYVILLNDHFFDQVFT